MKASEYHDIGRYLHDSRESLHISIAQAARDLHIRPKYLTAIEEGNLDELPGKAYTRGYIKNYIEYLRLDEKDVLNSYESLFAHGHGEFFVPELSLKQNMPSGKLLWWSLAAIFAVYLYWYFNIHDRTKIDYSVPEVPKQFMQLLDKYPHLAMDKPWEDCLSAGEAYCFTEQRAKNAVPKSRMYYDFGSAHITAVPDPAPTAAPASEEEPESPDQ